MKHLLHQASLAFDKGRYDEAERLYAAALAAGSSSERELYKKAAHGLAFAYCFRGKFDQARELYANLYRLVQEARDMPWQAIVLHQRGVVERMAGEFDRALAIFQEEYRFRASHLPDDLAGFAANLYEQGYILLKSGDAAHARMIMHRSLEIAQQANDAMCLGCAYRGLGEIYAALNERDQARVYFSLSEQAFRQAGDLIAAEEVQQLAASSL
ncbi:MAG: tetratricopeptide repeat protein [Roseiflexus sp.]|nr:tetratricopeptide repeat protein [Roseiflexus sp.]MCS7287804.1 tetratricopeptide repeat protein [Roseiflexus sp.]MDW8145682.1 tetratricopeptide repeat protein [Roseiflexaceae bacterium]MDW8232122.1 tetratricopeptide repeat protein [Roseiflexaceae bacterium]